MNILLLKPPSINYKNSIKKIIPPLGLAYIASFLERYTDHKIEIFDASLEGYENELEIDNKFIQYGSSEKDIINKIKEFNPDVVGIHLSLSIYEKPSLRTAEIIKKYNKDIKIVLGGVHATFCADRLIKNGNIDHIILGEGELAFLDLVETEENRSLIPGRPIQNLDRIPMPAYHLLNMEKYLTLNLPHNHFTKSERTACIITSRGCPGRCIFCSSSNFFGHKVRMRSVNNIKRELDYLIKNYNIGEIQFLDDNLTYNKERSYKIFKLLKSYGLPWCTPNGISINRVDLDMVKTMKDSGCYRLTYAIESGNERVVNKLIKKGINLNYAKNLIKKTRDIIDVHCFFIIGTPGETREEMEDTFNFIKETSPNSVSIAIAMPLPGSELYDICKENKYIKDDYLFDKSFVREGHIDTKEFKGKELELLLIEKNKELNEYLIKVNPKSREKYEKFARSHKLKDEMSLLEKV
jgi:anaerobic magnesium-protoporphyrin IX monomethyl ester cyclase